jgi:hypothetical protein
MGTYPVAGRIHVDLDSCAFSASRGAVASASFRLATPDEELNYKEPPGVTTQGREAMGRGVRPSSTVSGERTDERDFLEE